MKTERQMYDVGLGLMQNENKILFILFLFTGYDNNVSAAVVALATIGKLSIAATFGIFYVYSPELFPTDMR